MTVQESLKKLVDQGILQGVFIFDSSGNISWIYPSDWEPPIKEVFDAWDNSEITGFNVGDVRFSVIERDPERFVAMNTSGKGTIIVLKYKGDEFIYTMSGPGISAHELYNLLLGALKGL
ncbi:MAG: hypothetical protein ACTSX9_06130 [Candidatus Njordarchaeales archaeon]